jgi:hypothetical protein
MPFAQLGCPLGQGARIISTALKERADDLVPVTSCQWLQNHTHAQDRRNLGKRPECRVDMAGREEPADGRGLGADRAGKPCLRQSDGRPGRVELVDDPVDSGNADRLGHILSQELGVPEVAGRLAA